MDAKLNDEALELLWRAYRNGVMGFVEADADDALSSRDYHKAAEKAGLREVAKVIVSVLHPSPATGG